MKKYSALTQIHFKPVKRSLSMEQIEIMFIMAIEIKIERHRKFFNMQFTLPNGQYNKAVLIKRIPLGYIKKFDTK